MILMITNNTKFWLSNKVCYCETIDKNLCDNTRQMSPTKLLDEI